MLPNAGDVLALAGRNYSTEQVDAALAVITALAKSYCRADWTELPTDVAAVVLNSTVRYLSNPGQIQMAEVMGGLSVDYRGAWVGWTLPELACLNRYRVRAV